MRRSTSIFLLLLGFCILNACTNPTSTPVELTITPSATASETPTPSATPIKPSAQLVRELGFGTAESAIWSPDGKWIAVSGSTGVHLHDAQTMAMTEHLEANGNYGGFTATPLSFSLDGEIIAQPDSGHIRFWNRVTGESWMSSNDIYEVSDIVFSPNRTWIAVKEYGYGVSTYYALRVMGVQTGRITQTLIDYSEADIYSPTFSPDSRWLAAGSDDSLIRLWDMRAPTTHELSAHVGSVRALAFSPDGKWLLSGGADVTLRVWNAETWEVANTVTGFTETIMQIIFTPDGREVWVHSGNDWQIYDAHSLDKLRSLSGLGAIAGFNPDGQEVLSGFKVYSALTGQVKRELEGYSTSIADVAVGVDGKSLVVAAENGQVSVWDLPEGQLRYHFRVPLTYNARLTYNQATNVFAVIGGNEDNVSLWDASNGSKRWQLESVVESPTQAAFRADGGLLAVSGLDSILLIDTQTGTITQTLAYPAGLAARGLAFNTDTGQLIAVLGSGGYGAASVHAWDLDSGEQVDLLVASAHVDEEFFLSPNGRTLIKTRFEYDSQSDESNYTLDFFDAVSRQVRLRLSESEYVSEPDAFSADERLMVMANGEDVQIRDGLTGEELFSMKAVGRVIYGLAFSPDGNTLLAGTMEGTVLVWDISTIQQWVHAQPVVAPTVVILTATPTATPLPPLALAPIALPTPDAFALTADNASAITQIQQIGKGSIRSAGLSPDGKLLAVAGTLGIYIYDAQTLAEKRFIAVEAGASYARFTPDSQWVSAVEGWGMCPAHQWNVETGKAGPDLPGCVVYSPDGQLALYTGQGYANVIQVSTGLELYQPSISNSDVAFSPDGSRMANLKDGTIRIWDSRTGAIQRSIDINGGWLYSLEFESNDSLAWGLGGSVWLTNLATGQVAREIVIGQWNEEEASYSDYAAKIAFSPGGRWMATASTKGVRLWDAVSRKQVWSTGWLQGAVISLFFSPDGTQIFVADNSNTLQVLDARTGRVQRSLGGFLPETTDLVFNRQGELITAVRSAVQWWDVLAGQQTRARLALPGWMLGLREDGGQAAVSTDAVAFELWDLESRQALQQFQGELQGLYLNGHDLTNYSQIAFSPDGTALASGGLDTAVRLWDVKSGRSQEAFMVVESTSIGFVAFSPDGNWVAASGGYGTKTVVVMDAASRQVVRQLSFYDQTGLALAFQPDGLALATAGDVVQVWDIQTGRPILTLGTSGSAMAFSPDGSVLVTGDRVGTLKLWNMQTGKLARMLTGHKGKVIRIVFSHDGRWIASASEDNTVRVWGIP